MISTNKVQIDDIEIKVFNMVVGRLRCSCINGELHIKEFWVVKWFRNLWVEELFFSKLNEYAHRYNASQIIAYCGPEPFSKDGQVPVEEEVKLYKKHGFDLDHYVCGVVPCMIKKAL